MDIFKSLVREVTSMFSQGYQPLGRSRGFTSSFFHLFQQIPRRILATIVITIIFWQVAYYSAFIRRDHNSSETASGPDAGPKLPSLDHRLVIIVPVTGPDPELCKFLFTAAALGYPSPIIINWGLDYREVSKSDEGKALIKIPGILRYLEAVLHPKAHPDERLQDDDLVLFADGYDTWFQLPPELLLKRYHDINAKANAQLRRQWSGKGSVPMEQTIIAASQKRCWPPSQKWYNLRCNLLPESPLRKDLYGPDTDNNPDPESYQLDRPRYLNGGSYLGPAGDMQRMFRRIQSKLEFKLNQGWKLYSEQGLAAEVLGEQEVWRQSQRANKQVNQEMQELGQETFEYHLGLDYFGEISVATIFHDNDGEIVALNNHSAIDRYSAERGLVPARLRTLPADIESSQNPLANVSKASRWADMPLYADLFIETIPVTVHHNGIKERRTDWWNRMWYFERLRELLLLRLRPDTRLKPLTTLITEGNNITYWAPGSDKLRKRPRLFNSSALEQLPEVPDFDMVCRSKNETENLGSPWWDRIFRDGKGPLGV